MSKTLLLSPEKTVSQYANMPRGILTIDGNARSLNGKLRTYNLTISPNETVVGVYFNGVVYKAGIHSVERGAYSFSLTGDYADLSDIYFAFIYKNQVLLCGGTYSDCIADIKEQIFDEKPAPASAQSITNDTDDYETVAEEDINDFFMQADTKRRLDNIENIHNDAENVDSAPTFSQSMPYMEMPLTDNAFETAGVYPIQNDVEPVDNESVENKQTVSATEQSADITVNADSVPDADTSSFAEPNLTRNENVNQDDNQTTSSRTFAGDFFANISDQLDELLGSYPLDEELNAIVPDAKFVKIADSETGESYVLGVINQNGAPRYLAYGIPSTYDSEPPESMKGKCQWLPTDLTDPLSDGYYIIYQDTQTGNLINIDIV